MLKDLLFPKSCFSCGKWGQYICTACAQTLSNPPHQRCLPCQKPSLQGWTHPRCQNKFRPERLITIFDYHDQLIAQLINLAKLALVPEIFLELAKIADDRISVQQNTARTFVLCPIPQTRSKTRWRGFNQSELIAQVWADKFSLVVDRLLIKSRRTRQQKKLNKTARSVNLKNSFRLNQGQSVPKAVILVDDITTSGATFLEATKTLKRGGIRTVWCLAIAQD